jgi:hypothetical protein
MTEGRLPRRGASRLLVAASLLLGGCAAPTLSQQQLTRVSQNCGIPEGLLSQDVEERRFLLLDPVSAESPSPQVACVNRWARQRNLRLIYIETIDQEPQ